MGLELYVGRLTRYFNHDWKPSVRRWAESAGIEYIAPPKPPPPAGAITKPEAVHAGILKWRNDLVRLGEGDIPPLDWDESPNGEYFTNKLGWDGYWGLFFLAAHEEFPQVRLPKNIPPPHLIEDPTREPLFQAAADVYPYLPRHVRPIDRLRGRTGRPPPVGEPRYPHIFLPRLWLPADIRLPVLSSGLLDFAIAVGSVGRLLEELTALNDRTFQADQAAREQWQRVDPREDGDAVESVARYGISVVWDAAGFASEHRLPMLMSY